MRYSDFHHPSVKGQNLRIGIAVAVTAAFVAGLTATQCVCAAPKDDTGKAKSIYEVRNTSVYDVIDSGKGITQTEDDDSEVRRLVRIVTSVGNELNNEGFDFKYDSKHLKLDGDSGEVDDEGHPISIREKAHRELVHRLAFEQLKAQGYTWEKQKKELDKLRDQPDRWELERRRVAAARSHDDEALHASGNDARRVRDHERSEECPAVDRR